MSSLDTHWILQNCDLGPENHWLDELWGVHRPLIFLGRSVHLDPFGYPIDRVHYQIALPT